MQLSPSAMPKEETGVTKLLQSYPEADGRGILVAVLDTGCDLAAAGLLKTSDGRPKYIDFLDCTGGGDIDTQTVAARQPDGTVTGLSGRTLRLGSWAEGAAEMRLGAVRLFSLLPRSVLGRVKRERKASFEATQHAAVTAVQRELDALESGAVTGAAKAAAKKVRFRAGAGTGGREGGKQRGGAMAMQLRVLHWLESSEGATQTFHHPEHLATFPTSAVLQAKLRPAPPHPCVPCPFRTWSCGSSNWGP
jgi:hypothetical protein